MASASIENRIDAARDANAESAVLASCLVLGSANCKPLLSAGDFTDHGRRSLWKGMMTLRKQRKPIDSTLLVGVLTDLGLYGNPADGPELVDAAVIAQLFHDKVDMRPLARHRDEYAARVRAKTQERAELIRQSKRR